MLAPLGSPSNDGRIAFLPRDEKREEGRRRFDLRITVSNPPLKSISGIMNGNVESFDSSNQSGWRVDTQVIATIVRVSVSSCYDKSW